MNFAHVHLMLNHIPIIGLPLVCIFLIYSLRVRNIVFERFSLWMLLAMALIVIPIYLSGEPAEEVVEMIPGINEALIESHEEIAEISLVLTLIVGISAALALWFRRKEGSTSRWSLVTLGLAGLALASLVYTASLGGKIQHRELRSNAQVVSDFSSVRNRV